MICNDTQMTYKLSLFKTIRGQNKKLPVCNKHLNGKKVFNDDN